MAPKENGQSKKPAVVEERRRWTEDENTSLLRAMKTALEKSGKKTFRGGMVKMSEYYGSWSEAMAADGHTRSTSEISNRLTNIATEVRGKMEKVGFLKAMTTETGAATTKMAVEKYKNLTAAITEELSWFPLYYEVFKDDPKFELKSKQMGVPADLKLENSGRGFRNPVPTQQFSPQTEATTRKKRSPPTSSLPAPSSNVIDLVDDDKKGAPIDLAAFLDESPSPMQKKKRGKSSKSSKSSTQGKKPSNGGVGTYYRGQSSAAYREQEANNIGIGALTKMIGGGVQVQKRAALEQSLVMNSTALSFSSTSLAQFAKSIALTMDDDMKRELREAYNLEVDNRKRLQEKQIKLEQELNELLAAGVEVKKDKRIKRALEYTDNLETNDEDSDEYESIMDEEKDENEQESSGEEESE